jgi:hypothetical protein
MNKSEFPGGKLNDLISNKTIGVSPDRAVTYPAPENSRTDIFGQQNGQSHFSICIVNRKTPISYPCEDIVFICEYTRPLRTETGR